MPVYNFSTASKTSPRPSRTGGCFFVLVTFFVAKITRVTAPTRRYAKTSKFLGYRQELWSCLVKFSGYQRLPTIVKTSQKTVVFTPRNRQISLFLGAIRGSNPLRDASLQRRHSLKNKPSVLTDRRLFLFSELCPAFNWPNKLD